MLAQFPGLLMINNFAKANTILCVDQNGGKKFEVVITDEAALFLSNTVHAEMSSQI